MSETEIFALPNQGKYAGFVTRLAAWIIDVIIISAVSTLVGSIGVVVINAFEYVQIAPEKSQNVVLALVLIFNVTFYLLYYIFLWSLAGQTIGKAIMGLRIVRTDGSRLSGRRAFIRLLGYWISAILFLGYLWVLVDPRRQGFHDKLAGTMVVYAGPIEDRQPGRIRDAMQAQRQTRQIGQSSEQ